MTRRKTAATSTQRVLLYLHRRSSGATCQQVADSAMPLDTLATVQAVLLGLQRQGEIIQQRGVDGLHRWYTPGRAGMNTRGDRPKVHLPHLQRTKQAASHRVACDIADFLASGGKIETLAQGQTSHPLRRIRHDNTRAHRGGLPAPQPPSQPCISQALGDDDIPF